jgi:hypothetical protein
LYRIPTGNYYLFHATDGAALMLDKSSEAYGEKGYKLGNHHFYNPDQIIDIFHSSLHARYNRKGTLSRYPSLLEGTAGVQ